MSVSVFLNADARSTPAAQRSRHLVIVMPVFLPESTGGAERQCSILAPALASLGWRVTVLTPTQSPDLAKEDDSENYRVRRIRTRHLPFLGGRYLASTLHWTFAAMKWIIGRRDDIDVLYVFHARLHITPAVMAAMLCDIPMAVKIGRGGETFDFVSLDTKKFWYGALIRRLVRTKAAAFIANSREIYGDLCASGVDKARIHSIPNGVAISRRGTDLRCDSALMLYAGRLAPEKNLDILLSAMAKARLDHPDLRLLIAGDGPCREELKNLCNQLALGDSVTFLGEQMRLDDIYDRATYFISASDAEGQSNALLEAMARGLVPIVCQASGASEAVEEDITGFVFDRPEPDLIVAAVAKALKLSAEQRFHLAQRAQNTATESFDIDMVAKRTSDLLASLCPMIATEAA